MIGVQYKSFKLWSDLILIWFDFDSIEFDLLEIEYFRDKSKKKEVGGDDGNKPGKEALARVQDRLDGCVTTDRKRKGVCSLMKVIF